jgi:DNA invertase Pin-like site-specific DNA recombinase
MANNPRTFDRIYLYSRVSSEDQAEGQALAQQDSRLLRAYPNSKLYSDVQSGNMSDRPNYQELLRQVEADCADGFTVMVVVARLDRLSRNDHEIDRIIERWDSLGVSLMALDGGLYTAATPSDWLRSKNEGMFAQYFLRQLSANVRKGKDYKRRMGRPVGYPPFGYQYNADKTAFEPHPQQWAIARQLIEAYLPTAGKTSTLNKVRAIAKESGWDCSISGLRFWLINPTLRGHLWNREGGLTTKEKQSGVKKPLVITALNTHPALISEEEYRLIEYQLKENSRLWGTHQKRSVINVFSGMCKCGVCGYTMRYNRRVINEKEYVYLVCQYKGCSNTTVCPEGLVEVAVRRAIASQSKVIAEATAEPDEEDSPELIRLRMERDELIDMQRRSSMPKMLQQGIDELEIRIKLLTNNKSDQVDWGFIKETSAIISDADVFGLFPPEKRRRIYLELIGSIVITGRSVSVELNF